MQLRSWWSIIFENDIYLISYDKDFKEQKLAVFIGQMSTEPS